MTIFTRTLVLALVVMQCNVLNSFAQEGDIKYEKDPWDCVSKILKYVEYVKIPTKIVGDIWATLTAPKSAKEFSLNEFDKAKAFYLEGSETALKTTPKTFEEKLAFIETYSEKGIVLPLKLGEILDAGQPVARKRVAKLIDAVDIDSGLTEDKIFKFLVALYEIKYRAPSAYWGDKAISVALEKRVQVELMTKALKTRLALTEQLKTISKKEKLQKLARSKAFQRILSVVLGSVALKTYVPIYLPAVQKIRIPEALLAAIEKDGIDAHLEKLKKLYGNKINWGRFYEMGRRRYMLAAAAYNTVYAVLAFQQFMVDREQRDLPPDDSIIEMTLKFLGLS
ncbi:MAG: hypothetical protein KA715_13445 [Xanthomonadaceae bacterium]|nr:hypothetical protein [Xanthomonadaceae bacterium]